MKRDNDAKARIIVVLATLVTVLAGALVVYIYLYTQAWWRWLIILPVLACTMVCLAIDLPALIRYFRWKEPKSPAEDTDIPSALTLVSEEHSDVRYWDLAGKTSLVIGRSTDGSDVDVDLTDTEYFSVISEVHAALNFTDRGWFLEDTYSKNGTSILREDMNRPMELEPGEPVPLKAGDVIYLAGQTKLVAQ